MPTAIRLIAGLVLMGSTSAVPAVEYVNWENHPVHPIDISPDGTTLAVTHTADNRLQLFDLRSGEPVLNGHVVVGVDPVSVRFRTDDEVWVVNHISDTVSVVDLNAREVTRTIATADEPFDVVFAGATQRAYVSCSQANQVQVFSTAGSLIETIDIAAEDPRALAVSPDGSTVYVAIFESGNASTIVAGATEFGDFPPNAARESESPSQGQNPMPNDGSAFDPPLNPALSSPPMVGLIVKRDVDRRWRDDNGADWSDWVSGNFADRSGRVTGWDMPDNDIAVINTADDSVRYVTGLMNIGMHIAVNPASGDISLAGTDAINEVRFEPNVQGRFLRVNLAATTANLGTTSISDLNPHLDYSEPRVEQSLRDRSIGDPRGLLWSRDGARGYVAGMGSNNVVVIDDSGTRVSGTDRIEVGEARSVWRSRRTSRDSTCGITSRPAFPWSTHCSGKRSSGSTYSRRCPTPSWTVDDFSTTHTRHPGWDTPRAPHATSTGGWTSSHGILEILPAKAKRSTRTAPTG